MHEDASVEPPVKCTNSNSFWTRTASASFLRCSLLRRDLVVGELPVRLALLLRTHMHDRSCFAAIYNDSGLGVGTLSVALCTPILAFVERVGRFGVNLPGRALRNLNWLFPVFHQRPNL